jgi:hypothetical protein
VDLAALAGLVAFWAAFLRFADDFLAMSRPLGFLDSAT